MTAAEIIQRVRDVGGEIVLQDQRVLLLRGSRVPDRLAAIARQRGGDLYALLREFDAPTATAAVLTAEAFVSESLKRRTLTTLS